MRGTNSTNRSAVRDRFDQSQRCAGMDSTQGGAVWSSEDAQRASTPTTDRASSDHRLPTTARLDARSDTHDLSIWSHPMTAMFKIRARSPRGSPGTPADLSVGRLADHRCH
eukprot:8719011-Pyramimonas_sp.AAC.1